MESNKFKYTVDEFADIKIVRFKVPEFDKLSFNEKKYAYYLSEAAKWGRDITWMQSGKHNITLRKTLEAIINSYSGDKNTNDYKLFLIYAKRVFFSHNIYHHYGKHKFFPECSKEYFTELIEKSDRNLLPLEQDFETFKKWVVDFIYSPEKEKTGDLLLDDFTDFYENVSEKEAKDFYENLLSTAGNEPVEFGLNSKLIKENNQLKEIVYKEDGLYSDILKKIIEYLEKAKEVAVNDIQKEYTELLIKYFKTGDLKVWDEYNITWLKDNSSNINYINGFVETYDDPIGIKAIYEAMVSMIDYEASKITEIIAENAQWYEDNSPVDPRFKKTKVEGIKAKAIHAITLGGDCYPGAPMGINLPNSDWIREKHGSKSVSITNITYAINQSLLESSEQSRREFIYSDEEFELEEKYLALANDIHTHLHECLGHGSGKLLDGISPNSLKEYSSILEEARADIFSLYYMIDDKTIELGIVPSIDLAKTYYSHYIRNGLQTQLTRIELGKDIVQAHMRCRKIISTWSYEKGKKDNVIEKKVHNNKTYFVVNDHLKLRDIFKELLIELQRIKSEGDYEAGKKLVETYGVKVDYDLHKETLERYEKLNRKPYIGYMNPEIIPIKENGEVIDYQITYPDNFIEQSLAYGKQYQLKK